MITAMIIFGIVICFGLVQIYSFLKVIIRLEPEQKVKLVESRACIIQDGFVYTTERHAGRFPIRDKDSIILLDEKHRQYLIETSIHKITKQMFTRGFVLVKDEEVEDQPMLRKVTMQAKVYIQK